MLTLMKIAIIFDNNLKIISKPPELYALIESFLLQLFYIKKCLNINYNTSIDC